MNKRSLLLLVCLASPVSSALANDVTEADVRSAEMLDVIETTDGSVWKGVVVEQTPNVSYKIATADGSLHVIPAGDVVKLTKQRNRNRRVAPLGAAGGELHEDGSGGGGASLPPPVAKSGLRIEPELAFVFPSGAYDEIGVETSFSPGIRVGHEAMVGNFGLSGGAMARFTYWRLPGDTKDASWLLETQFYARAAMHIGPVTPYVGLSMGIDTNYYYLNDVRMSDTYMGLGMNLQSGVQISATPTTTIDIGFDYHPGTDETMFGDESVEYFAMRLGSTFRM